MRLHPASSVRLLPKFCRSNALLRLNLVAADVDKTITPTGEIPVAGANLKAMVRALTMGKRMVLISGSPYLPDEAGLDFSRSALSVKITRPLEDFLAQEGQNRFLQYLTLLPITGRDKITFNSEGRQNPIEINKETLIPPNIQVAIARALVAGFYTAINESSTDNFRQSSVGKKLLGLKCEAPGEETEFNQFLRSLLATAEVAKNFPKTVFWPFKSEIALCFYDDRRPSGETVSRLADEFLLKWGFQLNSSDYYRSYGHEFSKLARLKKVNLIWRELITAFEELRASGVKKRLVALGIGDSRADDHVYELKAEVPPTEYGAMRPGNLIYFPFYLGAAEAVKSYPDVVTVAFNNCDEQVLYHGFGKILDLFLDMELAGQKFNRLPLQSLNGQKTLLIDKPLA